MQVKIELFNLKFLYTCTLTYMLKLPVTPQTRGSIDYPSTRGIQVDVGLPDTISENRAKSPLYRELYL